MKLRAYKPADLEALCALFTASVHALAARHYAPAQLDAWAPRPPDLDGWRQTLQGLSTWVAEDARGLCGIIAWRPDGHVALLYTAPQGARRGVASQLLAAAEADLRATGVTRLQTEASLAARPFFEARGFHVVETQTVSRRNQTFTRFLMRKDNAA